MYLFTPNYPKLKTHLRLAVLKLKLLQRKQSELIQKRRKEIADLISSGKIQKAKFKVEQIISEDLYVDALEIMEMYCDVLLARFSLILNEPELNVCLAEAVSSIIWVAPHLADDVYELKVISNVLRSKYGTAYVESCTDGSVTTISEVLKEKFSTPAPSKLLIEKYMMQIAKSYNVYYEPDPEVVDKNDSSTSGSDPKPPGVKTYTQTPLVQFNNSKNVFPLQSFSSQSQTSDLIDDYEEEIILELPEKIVASNYNKTRKVESLEMPEFPFEYNDIIYDVTDLLPASDKEEKLRAARRKRYDLPFSPLRPTPYDNIKLNDSKEDPKIMRKNKNKPNTSSKITEEDFDMANKHLPSSSKDKIFDMPEPLDFSTNSKEKISNNKKNIILLIVSGKDKNKQYKDFLQLPSESNDLTAASDVKENILPELPAVPDEDIYILPEFPSIPNLQDVTEKHDVDFDELCNRFNKLRKK